MIHLTLERTKELLRECVAERGEDYVYGKPEGHAFCLYVHEQSDGTREPGCIVGLALHKAGVPLHVMLAHNARGVARLIGFLRNKGVIRVDIGVASLLYVVQGRQDDSWPWSEAVADAIATHG